MKPEDADDLARREAARELAERLATPEGLRTARLLQMAGLLGSAGETGPASGLFSIIPPPRKPPEPISIWEPRQVDGELAFVRPEPLPLGDHFAAARVLRPKKAELPLRVAFFGESVAAGYLYAPHLTPAQVLEAQLREIGRDFEVIDLARTNETIPTLLATVRSALQIQPDMLVIFVGNNWNLLETPEVSPYVPSVRARQRYAADLKAGVRGPLKRAGDQLRQTVEEGFDFLALLARTVQIPVVLVIPEVNLGDWETRQPVTWLPAGDTARWYRLHDRAVNALERQEWGEALTAAGGMQKLDGGACPTSHRLLARAFLGQGNPHEARRAAIAEVDAAAYATQAFLGAPQATTAARELLRGEAQRHGFFAVDLREIFAAHTGSPLPNRRLFLDYCHLTTEGMQVAMAAVAARVLELSGMVEEPPDWRGVLERMPPTSPTSPPGISREAEATARLGAAIHSAHRLLTVGPKAPILEHWLDRSLAVSPGGGIEAAMLDLIEARCAPCPAVLTAAQQRNLESPYRLQLQHGWQWDGLDADLIEAICVVLEQRGKPVRDTVRRLLLEHHVIREEGTELAVPSLYHWEPLERFYPEVMNFEDLSRRATYRSPWPESSFCLVCDASRDVLLDLTARLPQIEGVNMPRKGRAEVRINGTGAGKVELGPGWRRHELRLDRERLQPGLNRLTLRWPPPPPMGEAALRKAVERLELGLAADLHPVFGEVFSLMARPVDPRT